MLSALFMADVRELCERTRIPTYGVQYSQHEPMSKIDNHITKIDDFLITIEEGMLYIQGKAANKFPLYKR